MPRRGLSGRSQPACIACSHKESCLLFHRGVGVIRKKDLFVMEKVDLLVKYLVAWPAKQVRAPAAPVAPAPAAGGCVLKCVRSMRPRFGHIPGQWCRSQ